MDENKNIPPEGAENTPQAPVSPNPAPYQPYAYTPPPRYVFPMGKVELVFSIGILLFSLLLCNGLMYAGLNLAFAVGAAGAILGTFVYLYLKGHRPDRYTGALLILSLLIVIAFPRSDDGVMKFLMLCLLTLVPSLAFCLMAGQNRRSPAGILSLLDGPRALYVFGLGRMAESGRGIRQACSSTGAIGKKGSSVVLGLLIALPLLAVLVPLLMFADAAFEGLLDLLPEFQLVEALGTALFGAFLGYVLYTRAVTLQNLPKSDAAPKQRKGLNAITVNTVLISVSVLYLVYLFSQLAYFVGGFSGILPEDYTLAQYARRGFFEMGWLCAINLGTIALSIGLVSAKDKAPLSTRLICLFIGFVTLFLVAAASAKMLLYIGSYGLTRLRVLTEVFMIWLALSTVFVLVWLFRPKMPYMKAVMVLGLAFCAALMIADVDTQVAKYNVRAYQSGKLETVDVSHLDSLNLSAVPYLAELAEDANPEIAQMATDVLERKARWYLDEEANLRSWNYPTARAQEILKAYTEPPAAETEER